MPSRSISLPGLPSFLMAVHAENDQYVSPEILRTGQWEPFETEVILRCLDDGCDFYDIGANIGWYSVVAALRLRHGCGAVHAFEPALENAQLVLNNIISNNLDNVRLNACALGSEVRPIELRLSQTNKGDHQAHEGDEDRAVQPAAMTRFDRYYCPSSRRVFIKMDTQGSEFSVIEGMGEYLHSIADLAMLIEFWPMGLEHRAGNVDRLIGLLEAAEFTAHSLTEGDPFLRPVAWDRLRASAVDGPLAPHTGNFVNLLLCRNGDPLLDRLADLRVTEASSYIPDR